MEYRLLGGSGLKVSVLTMGTMTFGGRGNFAKVGNVGLDEVRRLIDLVADAGVNMIDTADVYSGGGSEELIGEAMGGKRKPGMLIATKARFPTGPGPNDRGLSRWHLIEACEASLKRLRTDVIDLYQVHQWDGQTPLEENHGGARRLGARGKGALRRLLQFFRLARDEGDGGGAPRPPHPLRFAADPLHAAGAREAEYETDFRSQSTRSSAYSSGAPSPAACSRASTGATGPRRRARGRWRAGESRR